MSDAPRRVVLVEDDDAIRYALQRKLARSGFEVVEAADARIALAMPDATFREAAVLVTDVVMPGMNGRELGAMLRARFLELPILYMSGYCDPEDLDPDELDARERFLAKPFTDGELWEALGELGVRKAG